MLFIHIGCISFEEVAFVLSSMHLYIFFDPIRHDLNILVMEKHYMNVELFNSWWQAIYCHINFCLFIICFTSSLLLFILSLFFLYLSIKTIWKKLLFFGVTVAENRWMYYTHRVLWTSHWTLFGEKLNVNRNNKSYIFRFRLEYKIHFTDHVSMKFIGLH